MDSHEETYINVTEWIKRKICRLETFLKVTVKKYLNNIAIFIDRSSTSLQPNLDTIDQLFIQQNLFVQTAFYAH